MKPMLAGLVEPEKLKLPVFASPKYNGVRGLITMDGVRSRKLLPFPNPWVSQLFEPAWLYGMDGEFIIKGLETAANCFHLTNGGLSKQSGQPDIMFHVFDRFCGVNVPFDVRYAQLVDQVEKIREKYPNDPATSRISLVEQRFCLTLEELLDYEEEKVIGGWEGIMVRSPDGPYKQGRSTTNEGYLLKFKRFVDAEAWVVGINEGMTNLNPATKDALGHTKRSSSKANKVPTATVGSLQCIDLATGTLFNCATGVLTAEECKALWHKWIGPGYGGIMQRVIKYRYQAVGMKNKPLFPRFQGFREEFDL